MNIESIDPLDEYRLQMTRRHFFSRCGLGLGTAALPPFPNSVELPDASCKP